MQLKKSLMHKTLTQFALCVALLLLLATPVFYWLTKNFYAEDMIEIVEAVKKGQPVPTLDIEEDIAEGIMIQFALIAAVVGAAIVVMMRFIAGRLWTPFNITLKSIENFRLDSGTVPYFPATDIQEFATLNRSLQELITGCLKSYRVQKEFTENASHEMQTPLAVFQSKLDLLLQQPNLTAEQANIIQDLSLSLTRLARLNRNLLLLAKMENRQFHVTETVNVVEVVGALLPSLYPLADDAPIETRFAVERLEVKANRPLLESLLNNLVVNAIRHSHTAQAVSSLEAADRSLVPAPIIITVTASAFSISNATTGTPLDAAHIFERFYRPAGQATGNGLGLAIAKEVCDYHGWRIAYSFEKKEDDEGHKVNHNALCDRHVFTVHFAPPTRPAVLPQE